MKEKALKQILAQLRIPTMGKNGKWIQFSCPFAQWTHKHGTDRSPSCGASYDDSKVSYYKCFSCKKAGRISSLVRSLEYYRDEEYKGLALEADLADAEVSFGEFEDIEDGSDDILPEPLSETAYADLYGDAYDDPDGKLYLKKRGISKGTAEYLGLGFDPQELRVTFPVRDVDNKLYGFTGRSVLRPEQFPYKGYDKVRDYLGLPKRHLLLGSHLVEGFNRTLPGEDDGKPIFVVEGLFGWAHLFEIGADEICHPVALMGSDLSVHKADTLKEWNRLTILAVDDDEGGDTCLFGAFDKRKDSRTGGGAIDKLYQHVPLVVPRWPDGKNDPDQLTFEEVEEMISQKLYARKKK